MDAYWETLHRIYNMRAGEIDLRLDRMSQALSLFGHPEKRFPALHIAGTNGKGSAAAMLHRILCSAGYRTALYISPHLVSFTERIRVGDQEISRDEVVALAEEITAQVGAIDLPLTFFEFITVMAFIYFARQDVEVAVVEVGLGGRLDATNLVHPVVSAITTISKDHEAYLGHDLLSIAREKGGIIKPGIPVVCGAVTAEVKEVLKKIAEERGSPSYFLGTELRFSLKNRGLFDYTGIKNIFSGLSLGLRGRHQKNNAAVALGALELISDRFPASEAAIRAGLESVVWPGRFEIMGRNPTVVLDGAHNGEGVKALAEAVEEFREGRDVQLLFASMEDKDWRLMLDTLIAVADEIVLTHVDMERSADPRDLANYVAQKVPCQVIEDSRTAIRTLVAGARPNDMVVVAGSLYLLGEVRPTLETIINARSSSNPVDR
ncbi:MAG TPA: folylpolyglutamate synthase/dihydrofolate synthase family protein [Candidatus Acidoferrales bacterium]|nr:folylpolyglutamate synthase/dihydrofolate synthase family protein [Candidatus Acidoferrales bacterium]